MFVSTSPDFAYTQLMYDIGNATTSLALHMYEVSDVPICDALSAVHARQVPLTLLVSQRINSVTSCDEAKLCYDRLQREGVPIRITPDYYTFSHQKVWIVNGARVSWSTGNMAETDYPQGSTFPPTTSWVNRDFTATITQNDVADVRAVASIEPADASQVFANVMEQDSQRGAVYATSNLLCGF